MPRKSGAPLSHKRRAQVFVPKVWRSETAAVTIL